MKISQFRHWVIAIVAASAIGAPILAQSSKKAQQVDTVMIVLTRSGFFPTQVKHSHNAHFVFVHNVTGLTHLTFTLANEHGAVSKQVTLTPAELDWREFLNLGAGKYTLTEASHPGWSCTINLQ